MNPNKPQHIVCLALPAWEAQYLRSTVELMKCASSENLVLYVDYAYTISDCVKGMLGKKQFDWKRLLGLKKRFTKISGDEAGTGLYLLSLPPVLPAFVFKSARLFQAANKFNAALTGYFINNAVKKLNMQDITCFNSFQPFLGKYWKIDNATFTAYYIYDDFSNVPWFNGFAVSEEEKFISKTDLVIVSSDELKRRRALISKPVEVVNNGVHFDSFYKNRERYHLNCKYIKTVGYTGTIDNRLDLDLLEYAVKEMPGTRFLFIGKIVDQHIYTRLIKYINVCFEPPVSNEQIPVLLSQIQVGIIPYVCNELTAAIYPLKANEYLAMGMPVVMTPFASIGEADDVVYTAREPKLFKRCLEMALTENDEQMKERRIAIARKADWMERAHQLTGFISAYKNVNYEQPKPVEI